MSWLRLHVSNVCNFRCPGCHVFQQGVNEQPRKIMALAVMRQALELYTAWMGRLGLRETWISLYGGETLINRRNIISLIREAGRELHGVRLNWVLNSNGSLLKQEDLDALLPFDVDFHISCDGPREVHDRMRPGVHPEAGTFHLVERALALLQASGARRQVNSYCAPANRGHLRDLIEIVARFEVSRIYLDFFYSPDDAGGSELVQLYRDAYYHARERGINVTGPWSPILTGRIQRLRDPESMGRAVEVNVDGTFFFTAYPTTRHLGLPIGDLPGWVEQGRHLPLLKQAARAFAERCRDCEVRDLCQGTAIQQYQYHLRVEEVPEQVCEVMRAWLSRIVADRAFGL